MLTDRIRKLLLWLLLLPLFPVFMTVPQGAGGGDEEPPPDDEGGDEEDDDSDDDEEDSGKTYTQEELDRIIQRRLTRERKKSEKDLADLGTFKASHEELQKLKEADMEEVDRLKKQNAELLARVEGEESDLASKREMLQERLIRLEVRRVAMELGFIDPDDAYLLADLSEVKLDEDTDEVTGVEKTLKALVKGKPHLVKEEGGPTGKMGTPPRSGKRTKSKAKVPQPRIRL